MKDEDLDLVHVKSDLDQRKDKKDVDIDLVMKIMNVMKEKKNAKNPERKNVDVPNQEKSKYIHTYTFAVHLSS